MAIPRTVKIKNKKFPTTPGVYLFKDKKGKIVYVGKATNLKSRVSSYWKDLDSAHSAIRANRGMGRAIDEMLHEVARIDWIITDSVIEALILEANLIKKYLPRYNVKEKDDKSFLYVAITKDIFSKVQLVRGTEVGKGKWRNVFGPYTSASSIRAALDLVRRWFPWSTCKPGQGRPCFDYHIGRCLGVCIGAVTRQDYIKNIRNVVLMLEGKKKRVLKNVEQEMKKAAVEERFEEAGKLRRKLFALQHIRDVAVITKESKSERIEKYHGSAVNIFGRIEGYDISNISGTSAVGSMVVFEHGEPNKKEYRRFRIKGVSGINDVAMMKEILARRFARIGWPRPDLILIDGGWGQVNVAREVLHAKRLHISVIGIAKGFKRKQDRPIFMKENPELARIVENHRDLLLRVRDEAHRFARAYHRKLRSKPLST